MSCEWYNTLIIDEQKIIGYISDIETYEIIYVTKTCMDLYGFKSEEEYKGKKCYKLLQGLDSPCPFCTNGKLVKGEKYCWEHFNKVLNSWASIEDCLADYEGRPCRVEIVRDITKEKEQLRQLSSNLTTEKALVKCIKALSDDTSMEQAVNNFLATIGQFYNANRAYVFEIDNEKRTFNNSFEWCADNVTAEIENLQNMPLWLLDDWMKKFRQSGEFYITSLCEDRDPDSEEFRILEAQGIQSLMAVPFVKEGFIVGFLGVDDPTENLDNRTLLRSAVTFIMQEIEKRRMISQLEYTSYTDMLTGLKNRNYYNTVISDLQSDTCKKIAVFFMDLDNLKEINDTYGHDFGDRNLIAVAKMLKKVFPGCDIFRTGGDEFVIFVYDCEYDHVCRKIEELQAQIKKIHIACSFGTCYQNNYSTIDEIIKSAENEMYLNKRRHHEFDNSERKRSLFIESIKQDLKDKRFFPVLQPKIDAQTRKLTGAEALIRALKKDGGWATPNEFIPIFEKNNCIDLIDYFMLEHACALQKRMLKQYGRSVPISVNVSRTTLLNESFAEDIAKLYEAYEIPRLLITMEITERMNLDSDELILKCAKLKSAGFTLEIDDFGSHFTNISFLCKDIFSTIKIDRTIITRLGSDSISKDLISFIIDKCHRHNVKVLAEGVETDAELKTVCDMNFDEIQGYYFDRPMNVEDFLEKYFDKNK